jgi:hypothetical protein
LAEAKVAGWSRRRLPILSWLPAYQRIFLRDLLPVLKQKSIELWIAGMHSQTRAGLSSLGIDTSVHLYDQVDEAVSAFVGHRD